MNRVKTARRKEIGFFEWGSRQKRHVAVLYAISWWPRKRKVQRINSANTASRKYWP